MRPYTPINPANYLLPEGETAEAGRKTVPPTLRVHTRAPELVGRLERLAVAASRLLKFRTALVNLRQPDGSYTVVAYTDPDGVDAMNASLAAECLNAMLLPEFRRSNSYLVPPEHALTFEERGAHIVSGAGPRDADPEDDRERWNEYHMLIVPLLDRYGEMIGFISVDKPRDSRVPSDADIADLETLAGYAALEIENFVLSHGLDNIEAVGRRLSRLTDTAAVGQAVAEVLHPFVSYDACCVYEVAGDELQPLAAVGEVERGITQTTRGGPLRVGTGLAGWSAFHAQGAIIPNVASDPRSILVADIPTAEESALLAPMLFEERVVGVIALMKQGLGQFHRTDLQVLQAMASHAATALEGARGRERERAETEAKLRAEARERAEREQAQRLAELSRLRDDFTAMVAHELASPIAAARGYATRLRDRDLPEGERTYALEAIRTELDAVRTLVADVQAVGRMERDDFAVALQPMPLRALLRDAETFAEALPGGHAVAVCFQPACAEVRVLADRARMGQVLRNLLENAAKYSEAGAPILVCAQSADGRVRIEVADRGPGIHPDDLDAIFEKFGRGRSAVGERVGASGAGLGLYLSRRIVEAHGAALCVRSTPGEGSVFSFELEDAD